MRLILLLILLFSITKIQSQVEFLSGGSDGELILSTSTGCCEKSLGFYDTYIDIAITPNGAIYGLNGNIYKIDTLTVTSDFVSTPLDQNGVYSAGAGLVALDNDYLLSDRDDSLFLIEINSGYSINLGKIGYYCNGDLAFYNGTLYMASEINELIKIDLDPLDYSITNVENIGIMSSYGAVYALFTSFDGYNSSTKSLFAIDGYSVYKVNTNNANLELSCNFDSSHISYGAASIYDFDNTTWNQQMPNVFTPNNDGINDFFAVPLSYNITSFVIINRWGNIMYEWTEGEKKWDGYDQNGNEALEGVYYYIVEILNCNENNQIQGFLTLIR